MSPDIPLVPDGSAIITPNQQYAELQALRQSVDKLTATIDPALLDIRKDIHDLDQKTRADIDEVHRSLQAQQAQIDVATQWRNRLIGAFTLLSALVAYGLLNLAGLGIGGK